MDQNNIDGLKREAPANSKAKILLLGDYDPQGDKIIRDPYYVSVDLYNRLLYVATSIFEFVVAL